MASLREAHSGPRTPPVMRGSEAHEQTERAVALLRGADRALYTAVLSRFCGAGTLEAEAEALGLSVRKYRRQLDSALTWLDGALAAQER